MSKRRRERMIHVISIIEHKIQCPCCLKVWGWHNEHPQQQCPRCQEIFHSIHPDVAPIEPLSISMLQADLAAMTAERDGLKAENYDIKEYLEQAHNTEIELIAMTAERDDAIRRIDCTNKACRTCTGAVYPARAEKIIEAMTAERDAAQKHEGLAYQMVDELRGIIGTTYTEEQVNAIRQQTVEEVVNVFEQLCKDYASPTGNIYNLDIISAIRKEFLS